MFEMIEIIDDMFNLVKVLVVVGLCCVGVVVFFMGMMWEWIGDKCMVILNYECYLEMVKWKLEEFEVVVWKKWMFEYVYMVYCLG